MILISVLCFSSRKKCQQKWSTLEETEDLESENTNKKHESGKASTPRNTAAQSAFGQFPAIFGGGPFFAPPAATPLTGFSQSFPACLMPEPINGSGEFEDYLGQFSTDAYLPG